MKTVTVPFFIAHQGCPHRCVFCNQVSISGGPERLPEPGEMLERIAAYRASAGESRLDAAFFGGTFTSLPRSRQEALLAPLRPLLRSGEIASVRISTRPDALDRETAVFLGERGVETVEIGVQSLDDTVLSLAGRGHSARDAEEAVSLLSGAGFRVGIQLMPGLPGDTPETALASFRRAIGLRPGFLRIYPTLVFAGTELERRYRDGTYTPLTLADAVSLCKVMRHEALRASIPVVRIGLQATGDLREGGEMVAGPWHPAFRQMVEAELFFDLMSKLSCRVPQGEGVTFRVSPGRLSDAAGQCRANLKRLGEGRGWKGAAIRPDPRLSPLEVIMEAGNHVRTGSLLNDLDYSGGDTAHA